MTKYRDRPAKIGNLRDLRQELRILAMIDFGEMRQWGADPDTGLTRCAGNAGLYEKLIGMILDDSNFTALEEALRANDLEQAFQKAHGLKGTTGNLALTPLFDAICQIVEPLRVKDADFDYNAQMEVIKSEYAKLKELVK